MTWLPHSSQALVFQLLFGGQPMKRATCDTKCTLRSGVTKDLCDIMIVGQKKRCHTTYYTTHCVYYISGWLSVISNKKSESPTTILGKLGMYPFTGLECWIVILEWKIYLTTKMKECFLLFYGHWSPSYSHSKRLSLEVKSAQGGSEGRLSLTCFQKP